jgi:hypothetical protein
VAKLKLKTLEEIAANCREMIHRYRRRWLKRNLRPCPNNCKLADMVGRRVVGCEGCGSRNPEQCTLEKKFEPLYTKEELHQQFRDRIRNQEILQREYRDITALLWVMGGFDEEIEESVIAGVEQREKPPQPDSSPSIPAPSSSDGGSGPVPKPNNPKPANSPARPAERQRRSSAVQGGSK